MHGRRVRWLKWAFFNIKIFPPRDVPCCTSKDRGFEFGCSLRPNKLNSNAKNAMIYLRLYFTWLLFHTLHVVFSSFWLHTCAFAFVDIKSSFLVSNYGNHSARSVCIRCAPQFLRQKPPGDSPSLRKFAWKISYVRDVQNPRRVQCTMDSSRLHWHLHSTKPGRRFTWVRP